MKAEHLIAQMLTVLPKKTSLFSESVPITSLSFSGGVVTAVTGSAHGSVDGKFVTISGALYKTAITSLTRVGSVVTAVCTTNHDLTEGYHTTVTVEGADQSEYNGTYALTSTVNRKTFTYTITGTPVTPATGTISVLEDRLDSYNGRYAITVVNSTTFTYATTASLSATASGTPLANVGVRVSGAITPERAEAAYTKQATNELWAFVVLGDTDVSRDRSILDDASQNYTGVEAIRIREIEKFSVFVFIPTTGSIAGREERDLVEDISVAFYKTLFKFKAPSPFVEGRSAIITPEGHNFSAYRAAYYIHQFNFQTARDIVGNAAGGVGGAGDGVDPADNAAFKNMQITFNNDFDEVIMQTDIDLDEEPL